MSRLKLATAKTILETFHILLTDRYKSESTSPPTICLYQSLKHLRATLHNGGYIIFKQTEMSFCKHDNINRVLCLSDMIDVIASTIIIPKLN